MTEKHRREDMIGFSVYMTKNLRNQLQELARRDSRSLNRYVTMALEEHVKRVNGEKEQ